MVALGRFSTADLAAHSTVAAVVTRRVPQPVNFLRVSLRHPFRYPLCKPRCHARRNCSRPLQLAHGGAEVGRIVAVAAREWGVAFPLPAAVDATLAGGIGDAVCHNTST